MNSTAASEVAVILVDPFSGEFIWGLKIKRFFGEHWGRFYVRQGAGQRAEIGRAWQNLTIESIVVFSGVRSMLNG